MRAYIIAGLALTLLLLAGYAALERGWRQGAEAENAALTRELQTAEAVAEQAQLARAVEAAHRLREATRAAKKERALEALLTGDFNNADTAIDPRIADFLSCMRREADRNPDDCAGGLGGPANAGADQ